MQFSSTTQLVGAFLVLLGLQMILLAQVASGVTDYQGVKRAKLSRRFDLNRMSIVCSSTGITGIPILVPLMRTYLQNNLSLDPLVPWEASLAIGGVTLLVASFCLFTASLVVQIVFTRFEELASGSDPQLSRKVNSE